MPRSRSSVVYVLRRPEGFQSELRPFPFGGQSVGPAPVVGCCTTAGASLVAISADATINEFG
jgi:hypothetical protein